MEVGIASALRERHRAIRDTQSEALAIRLHRAISWLAAAENSLHDNDTRFIQLWIAFNAAYAIQPDQEQSEYRYISAFIKRLVAVDEERQPHTLLFKLFNSSIRLLIESPYVFAPLSEALRTHDAGGHWKERFGHSHKKAMGAQLGQQNEEPLDIVLRHPPVLRNSLNHDGSTWNSSANPAQLYDGGAQLTLLVPTFISLITGSSTFDADPMAYPVLPDFDLPENNRERNARRQGGHNIKHAVHRASPSWCRYQQRATPNVALAVHALN